jgi:hypothetical protein
MSDPEAHTSADASVLHAAGLRVQVDWFLIASVSTAALMDATLLRYGIDLVPPLCVVALLVPSVRDAVGEWMAGERYKGERDPIWAVLVVSVHLIASALALMWIFSTSKWMANTVVESWLPRAIVETASFAEQYGWGRRAVLPGGPSLRTVSASAAPDRADNAASASATDSRSERAGAPASTSGQLTSTTSRTPPNAPAATTRRQETTTTLSTSHALLQSGSTIRLTAVVSGAGAPRIGSVMFRSDGALFGLAPMDSAGRAILTTRTLSLGEHIIVAEFAGNADLSPSRSSPVPVRVVP